MTKIQTWDLPIRVFHVLFGLSILAALGTGFTYKIQLHLFFGLFAAGLLVFRILWGILPTSETASLKSLFFPIKEIYNSVITLFNKQPAKEYMGHTPSGGLFIAGFLSLIILQITLGLLIAYYLFKITVSAEVVSLVYRSHTQIIPILIIAGIVLHITVNFHYLLFKKQNLIRPMVVGFKNVKQEPKNIPKIVSPVLAVFALAYFGVLAVACFIFIFM